MPTKRQILELTKNYIQARDELEQASYRHNVSPHIVNRMAQLSDELLALIQSEFPHEPIRKSNRSSP